LNAQSGLKVRTGKYIAGWLAEAPNRVFNVYPGALSVDFTAYPTN